jgi:hypothetical protein
MSTPATIYPIQAGQFTEEDLKDPGRFNVWKSQIENAVNALIGARGPVQLPTGIDVQGAKVTGIGRPSSPTDAVSLAHAENSYSAAALAPQLESGSKNALKSYRALNSKQQQESYSTFLNKVANTAPTTNTTTVIGGAPSGGTVSITIPAGFHKLVDGSIIPFGTFTDTVALPSSQSISSLTRSSGVVTASGTFSGLSAGEPIYTDGVTDSSFDGTFTLTSATGTTLTWNQPNQVDASSTGGTVSTGGVYYFFLKNPSQQLAVSGPFPADTQENRLAANADGQVLIAVAVVNSSGVVDDESAAGATLPSSTNGNRIVSRL